MIMETPAQDPKQNMRSKGNTSGNTSIALSKGIIWKKK